MVNRIVIDPIPRIEGHLRIEAEIKDGVVVDAYSSGTVRFLHFPAAFLFFFNFVFRIYWGFVGNTYARWPAFIPFKKTTMDGNR
jgi:Ni,Fe-hydrogenase I cytochrome b subunit